jgi:hypothetical protein
LAYDLFGPGFAEWLLDNSSCGQLNALVRAERWAISNGRPYRDINPNGNRQLPVCP